ncbi:MAG: hydrogenase expression/formation protein HypE [Anaerolineae bacterium]|nr:hydrogenase expression/formation protein HypE [Anaerolineae bacterium]
MEETILLAHGSGGILSHELIRDVFARQFSNPFLDDLSDAALVGELPSGRLAMTTDSYVVQPLFFPGGDIGKLAVCGTVNDLAVAGARPLYLTAGFILEEGLPMETLERVVVSMAEMAREAGVAIVTGDTKVVEHGAADGLFINTAGVGVVPPGITLGPAYLRPGDALLINGPVGDHGLAVMLKREGMGFQSTLQSDVAPLYRLIAALLDAVPGQVRCMRDVTRGGLASVLNEWASPPSIPPDGGDGSPISPPQGGRVGIEIEESAIPIREAVRGACEFLGLDPLYAANEGKVIVAVAAEAAEAALSALRAHPLGEESALIGHVTAAHAGRVVLQTPYGAKRILPMLTGAQLPRIC